MCSEGVFTQAPLVAKEKKYKDVNTTVYKANDFQNFPKGAITLTYTTCLYFLTGYYKFQVIIQYVTVLL